MVDPDDDLTDVRMPDVGTDGHVTLLLAEHLAGGWGTARWPREGLGQPGGAVARPRGRAVPARTRPGRGAQGVLASSHPGAGGRGAAGGDGARAADRASARAAWTRRRGAVARTCALRARGPDDRRGPGAAGAGVSFRGLPQPERERWQPLRPAWWMSSTTTRRSSTFRDGRLLLRGNNGTGKSKVLAFTLPFLLDGELSATGSSRTRTRTSAWTGTCCSAASTLTLSGLATRGSSSADAMPAGAARFCTTRLRVEGGRRGAGSPGTGSSSPTSGSART